MSQIELMHSDLTEQIIGAFYHVYNELGTGLLESLYQRAMHIALTDLGVAAEREVPASISFRGHVIGSYRIDLVVDGRVLVECKTVERIAAVHRAQLINYLRVTNHEVGLILNFGSSPAVQRVVFCQ